MRETYAAITTNKTVFPEDARTVCHEAGGGCLDCSSSGLFNIPSNINTFNPICLKLYNNKITNIDNKAFNGLTNLTRFKVK